MRNIFGRTTKSTGKRDWLGAVLKGKALPILGIASVVAITVIIIRYRESIIALGALSYPGIFLGSMLWNATVLVPIPSFWIYFGLGTIPTLHYALIGLAGGSGAAVGELTSYMAGYSGRAILNLEKRKTYDRVRNWIKKWGFWVIFGFNLVPVFPFDIFGIAAGALRFPLWKFYLAAMAGRTLAYGAIAFAGAQGWIPPLPFLNPPQ
jgi:membrane protein YqaA with SNARE-associated domain